MTDQTDTEVTQAWVMAGMTYGPVFASEDEARQYLAVAEQVREREKIELPVAEWSPAMHDYAYRELHPVEQPELSEADRLAARLAEAEAEIAALKARPPAEFNPPD